MHFSDSRTKMLPYRLLETFCPIKVCKNCSSTKKFLLPRLWIFFYSTPHISKFVSSISVIQVNVNKMFQKGVLEMRHHINQGSYEFLPIPNNNEITSYQLMVRMILIGQSKLNFQWTYSLIIKVLNII